jgi:hypothetical protein
MAPFLKPALVVVASAIGSVIFTGCISDRAAKEIGREFGLAFSAPIFAITALSATDLLYCCGSFRKKTERWPKDYTELSEFVEQSNGYLWLRDYERVNLTHLPEDVLEISFVPRGGTNEMKLRLTDKPKRQ